MAENEVLFQLVVVGSSAGGVEALSKLVADFPTSFPVPIVIAQHLDPKRPSHLAEILARHSSLPVVMIKEKEKLQGGTIYVVPSNHHVMIDDHEVSVTPHVNSNGRPKPSIDLLLNSAAEVYGEKLIAVILTGTGSDGTAGAQTVHDAGGTVVIQNPSTAAYPGMPQSLAHDTVDLVADLSKIGTLLFDLINGKAMSPQVNIVRELQPFLSQLHEFTGIDFRTYKSATILRRLQRRLVATNCTDLASYGLYLQAHPEEYERLVNDFLIKVTEFRRDPELFTILQEQVLPELIEYSQAHDHELRFWSAGCATGEEAYSLAILLCETLGERLGNFHIKIFATDLDENAIAFARHGIYPAKALVHLPEELIQRYFTPGGVGYEIKKLVRNLLVFGEHDLAQRAPFPRIDLVMCRNVLIYFNRELQKHALQLFAFALRDSGYLVLGRTETASPLAEFFTSQEAEQRIYRRQGQRLGQPIIFSRAKSALPSTQKYTRRVIAHESIQMQHQSQQSRDARDNLLLKLPVGVVVVDQRFDILEINNAARRLLSIHTSAIGEDFVHLARHVPPRELDSAITTAIRDNITTTLDSLEVPHVTTGEATFLQLTCYPHPAALDEKGNGTSSKYALILVTDITTVYQTQGELKQANLEQVRLTADLSQNVKVLQDTNLQLQQSNARLLESNTTLAQARQQAEEVALRHTRQMEVLVETNRNLLAANEELTALTEDLRTGNEEYLMHTEEAQAAIEEVDTLNEELQASNEELETLNEELQATIEELNTTNSDLAVQGDELVKRTEAMNIQRQQSERERAQLAALLTSMADAVVVVDLKGNVLLTNLTYASTFQTENEIELLEEAGEQALQNDDKPLARAARGETFSMVFSFRTPDDNLHWWEAIGQQVRGDGVSDWGMVVMRDITDRSLRRLQEQFLSLVGHELRTPLTIIKGHNELAETQLKNHPTNLERPLKSIGQALFQVGTSPASDRRSG